MEKKQKHLSNGKNMYKQKVEELSSKELKLSYKMGAQLLKRSEKSKLLKSLSLWIQIATQNLNLSEIKMLSSSLPTEIRWFLSNQTAQKIAKQPLYSNSSNFF